MSPALRFVALAVLVAGAVGCTRVVVHKDPPACDTGFRFWRPKPYLFIGPAPPDSQKDTTGSTKSPAPSGSKGETTRDDGGEGEEQSDPPLIPPAAEARPAKKTTKKGSKPPGDGGQTTQSLFTKVVISIQYLPDYNEEYSVQMKPGLGIGTLNFTFKDGWNLTSVGSTTNQETPEILGAVASLIGAAKPGGSVGASSPSKSGGAMTQLAYTGVHKPGDNQPTLLAETAREVPLGFYEPVIGVDDRGCKTLFGWRYVGFLPFAGCPVAPVINTKPVGCDPTQIYGLYVAGGSLKFDTLAHIAKGVTHVGRDGVEYTPKINPADASEGSDGKSSTVLTPVEDFTPPPVSCVQPSPQLKTAFKDVSYIFVGKIESLTLPTPGNDAPPAAVKFNPSEGFRWTSDCGFKPLGRRDLQELGGKSFSFDDQTGKSLKSASDAKEDVAVITDEKKNILMMTPVRDLKGAGLDDFIRSYGQP